MFMGTGKNGRRGYPPFAGERVPLAEALANGGGRVAGRWYRTFISDESARVPILATQGHDMASGDWVSGLLTAEGLGWILSDITVHAVNRLGGMVPEEGILARKEILKSRVDVVRGIREYFDAQGFLEVETPYRVQCPAVEPYLEAVASGDRYLITSPELHMKRLLVAGFEKVYQIARVFRGHESGKKHLEEFTLLEWYRAWSEPAMLMTDCEFLVESACHQCGRPAPARPYERIPYRDLYEGATGLDPFACERDLAYGRRLQRFAEDIGIVGWANWDVHELIEGVFVRVVEPSLAGKEGVFVTEFPSWAAVLARVQGRGDGAVADRFELYLDGIELANAYHEVTDPDVNHERLLECGNKRRAAGGKSYPMDTDFSRALEAGMPPSSGIALGIDRFIMWLIGIEDIRDTVPFI